MANLDGYVSFYTGQSARLYYFHAVEYNSIGDMNLFAATNWHVSREGGAYFECRYRQSAKMRTLLDAIFVNRLNKSAIYNWLNPLHCALL